MSQDHRPWAAYVKPKARPDVPFLASECGVGMWRAPYRRAMPHLILVESDGLPGWMRWRWASRSALLAGFKEYSAPATGVGYGWGRKLLLRAPVQAGAYS